ncbi:MAG: glycosyltransferase [Candidatus Shapirobacteria bacterium]|jgi:glycosyltransferase involved in cell wall biosynthesis
MKIIIIPNMPVMTGRHYCLAKTLVEQGHEVHYLMWALPYKIKIKELIKNIFTSLIPKQSKYESFIVHKAIRFPYFFPYVNGWIFKYQIRNLYKKIGAEIIFSESWNNETEVPKDLPVIYDLADDYAAPAEVYGSFFYKLAFKLMGVSTVTKRQCQNALAVTVVSEALYKYAKKYNKNVYKLPNGVDKNIIEKVLKDKSTYPKNKYSMIYVTGFGQWSRAIETLQTVVNLHKEFPLIDLTLVGNGIEESKMLNFIKDNKVENYIHYLGFVKDRKKVFSLINKSSIGLHISDKNKWRDAAHPIKVLEYSALGKKAVSTDLDEVKALNFPNVFIFSDQKGKDNLLKTMRLALEDKRDHTDFKDISKYVLDTFSWEDLTTKLIEIINKSKAKGEK